MGLAAVTSQGGSGSAHKASWVRLKGVETVFLLPDKDESGAKYIADVSAILRAQDSDQALKIIELKGLPEAGDIVDWIQLSLPDWDGYQKDPRIAPLKEKLRQIVKSVTVVQPDTNEQWPDLEPLPEPIPPVDEFDYELLPVRLRPYIEVCAASLQCPPEYLATACVVSLASLIGRQVGIRPKRFENWTIVPNLWGGNIGLSAQKKTPAQDKGFKFLLKLDDKAQEVFRREEKSYQAESLRRKAEFLALKNELDQHYKKKVENTEDAASISAKMAELKEQDEAITVRRYWTSDATIEKLAELLSKNSNGLLVKRDELMGWLRSMNRSGHEGDRAFYLESHSGDGTAYSDRIERGTTRCEGVCLSIHGNIQPGPLSEYVREAMGDHQGADGLLQRFQLLVWPDSNKKWNYVDKPGDPTSEALAQSAFDSLDSIDLNSIGATTPENGLPYLQFDDEAQDMYIAWTTELNQRILTTDEHPAFISHLGKYDSLMPSLALILHLADGGRGPVSLQAAAKAADWCEFLESHARRIYASCIHPELKAAQNLATKIKSGKVSNHMTIRDIYRKGWSGLNKANLVKDAISVLEEYGWIRIYEIETKGASSQEIRLHPDLCPTTPST
jgi:putative DNA primase/helicase